MTFCHKNLNHPDPIPASAKLNPDMVLEDVESDNECQHRREDYHDGPGPTAALTPTRPASEQTENGSEPCQEDAETQTGRWTPFIQSIKMEAEGVALATMEER